MRLSSKLCVLAGLGSLLVAPAMAAGRGPGMTGHVAAPRISRIGTGARVGRDQFRREGGGDLGYAGAALATSDLADDGYGAPPPVVVVPEPPPIPILPACPMIIKVGPGLDHPVQTRVIYGAPACQ